MRISYVLKEVLKDGTLKTPDILYFNQFEFSYDLQRSFPTKEEAILMIQGYMESKYPIPVLTILELYEQ